MRDDEFDLLIHTLLGGATPRVWSLLVTMFGDLAVAPKARLSGACVNALTAAIGIKPEATRVALHRLRKEGWIESHRSGRQSRYGLTEKGRVETNAAWPRVYGPAPTSETVYLALDDPASASDPTGAQPSRTGVQIAPRTNVTTSARSTDTQWLVPIDASVPVPQWVSDRLCPPEVQQASRVLATQLQVVLEDGGFEAMTVLQQTALREVIVHEWPRLILRAPALPEVLFSDAWKGPACRKALSALLQQLPAPDIATLERQIENA